MKNKIILMIAISVFGMSFGGCTASFSTGNTSAANTAKTTNTTAEKKDSSSNEDSTSTKKSDKPKTVLTSDEKPEGTSKKVKENPVPDDWVYVYDENKGYGFSVPEGTTGGSESQDGVDTYYATTPAPSEISVVVIAFKDRRMNKKDLLDVGENFLKEMGETVTTGELVSEDDVFSVADVMTVSSDGSKGKGVIMVGTDITDNYVMVVGMDESKYAANAKIIDEIWGSFEIWSGVY